MSGSKSSGTAKVPTYYVGMQLVLCHAPIDKITEVYVDTTRTAWKGDSSVTNLVMPASPELGNGWSDPANSLIVIGAPELFGGATREGGIMGYVDICLGELTQGRNAYLQRILGTNIPAFRGVVTAVLNHVYIGNNYYMKLWGFVGTSIHKRRNGEVQWYDETSEPTLGNMNPAHIIRECLTNTSWGLGLADSLIDDYWFQVAANTLYNEEFGLSFLWTNTGSVQDFINDICRHIQASVYEDRTTGKFVIKLTRKLTDFTGLITLDETNIKEVSNFSRKSLSELASKVTVKYPDNKIRKTATVSVVDVTLSQRQDTEIEKSIEYLGVADLVLAQRLAVRDLGQLSVPTYSATIVCNRVAENLNPGDAFLFTWEEDLGQTLTMRVSTIDLGTATSGQITITCVQDVFSAADVIYETPPETFWTNPIQAPVPMAYRLVGELPYYQVATLQGDTFAQAVAIDTGYVFTAGASPTGDSIHAETWTTTGSTYVYNGITDFCCTGLLAQSLGKSTTTFAVSDIIDFELLIVGKVIQIDNELMQVTAASMSSFTVIRGVQDTIPEIHGLSSRFLAWGGNYDTYDTLYTTTEVVHVKLLTTTPVGVLDQSLAPVDNVTFANRLHRPYPPGNVKVNTISNPSVLISGLLTLTWASRNRIQQTVPSMTGWYDGSVTSEVGVTYEGKLIKVSDGSVIDSWTGETGVTRTLNTGVYLGLVRVELLSRRDGLESYQKYSQSIDITASGTSTREFTKEFTNEFN